MLQMFQTLKMPSLTFSLFSTGVMACIAIVRIVRIGRRPSGLPPGPPTVPVLGNIHQVCKLRDAYTHTVNDDCFPAPNIRATQAVPQMGTRVRPYLQLNVRNSGADRAVEWHCDQGTSGQAKCFVQQPPGYVYWPVVMQRWPQILDAGMIDDRRFRTGAKR